MKEEDFAISRKNARLLLLGFGIVVLGFILMIGGAPSSPEVWYQTTILVKLPRCFRSLELPLLQLLL